MNFAIRKSRRKMEQWVAGYGRMKAFQNGRYARYVSMFKFDENNLLDRQSEKNARRTNVGRAWN